jgi:hypothetical protein
MSLSSLLVVANALRLTGADRRRGSDLPDGGFAPQLARGNAR